MPPLYVRGLTLKGSIFAEERKNENEREREREMKIEGKPQHSRTS